jgi:hypothetical protein
VTRHESSVEIFSVEACLWIFPTHTL